MALPKCPHCGDITFAVTTIDPVGSQYKANLIHCLGCGAPFGALEYYDAEVLLHQILQKLNDLERRIQHLGG
jgi:hypothetical protein